MPYVNVLQASSMSKKKLIQKAPWKVKSKKYLRNRKNRMKIHDDPDDNEYFATMKLQRREISDEQYLKFEGYAAEIFSAFGLDLNLQSTKDTPRRFIKALF